MEFATTFKNIQRYHSSLGTQKNWFAGLNLIAAYIEDFWYEITLKVLLFIYFYHVLSS